MLNCLGFTAPHVLVFMSAQTNSWQPGNFLQSGSSTRLSPYKCCAWQAEQQGTQLAWCSNQTNKKRAYLPCSHTSSSVDSPRTSMREADGVATPAKGMLSPSDASLKGQVRGLSCLGK